MADKFRQAKVSRHVRIYHKQMQSVAWLHLTGSAVKVLLALAVLEKGDNNGEFFLSVRRAAELTGLSKGAANRAFHELIDKGFIYCAERGGFSRKTPHAACWGLTWQSGPKGSEHRAPSHAYEKWRPEQNRGPRKQDTAVPDSRTVEQNAPEYCLENRDSETVETPENCQVATVSKSGTHNSYQALPAQPSVYRHPASFTPAWWQPDLSLPLARLAHSAILSNAIQRAIADRTLAA